MSDLTKCATEGCPSSALCWRKQAPSNDLFQSYSLFDVPPGADRCGFFWSFVSSAFREEERRLETLNRNRDDEIIPSIGGGAR